MKLSLRYKGALADRGHTRHCVSTDNGNSSGWQEEEYEGAWGRRVTVLASLPPAQAVRGDMQDRDRP